MSSRKHRLSRQAQPRMEALEPRLLLDAGAVLDAALDELLVTDRGLDVPPPGYNYSEQDAPAKGAGGAGVTKILNVPEYIWYHGCAPTSGGMILGYWDTVAYPNYFPGDASTQTNDVNDRIASSGHIADYVPTPDRTPPPPYHTDDCIADFMLTSRVPDRHGWSNFGNVDDGFIDYSDFVGYSAAHSWNETYGDLTFDDLKAEIDAGRPMMFLVDSDGDGGTDHFVPIVGYRTDPSNQYGCHTTWNRAPGEPLVHWYDWQGKSNGHPWGIHGGTYFHPCWGSPDLAGVEANAYPEPRYWGDTLTFAYGVKNYGSAAAGGFRIRFYMSSNDLISTSDYELGSVWIGGLAAGAAAGGTKLLSLPDEAHIPPGFSTTDEVWIGMIVDADGDVAEGVESNNRNLGQGKDFDQLHIDSKADLVGTDFELDMPMLNFGSVTADFTVENTGQGDAGGFYVAFYLSENAIVSTGDTFLGVRWISGLDAGDSYSGSIVLSPGTSDPFGGDGTYTIGMVIDYDGRITEADETNNRNEGYGLDKARVSYGKKIFFADFEHGDGAMNIINDTAWAPVDGLWHVTTRRGAQSGHSSTHSMYYGREFYWDYDVGDSAGVFYTKRLELPDEPVALSFNYWAETENSDVDDRFGVQIYDPDTSSYTYVLKKGQGLLHDTGGTWREAKVDISEFGGKNVQLRFLFVSDGADDNDYEGVFIDDIAVWAASNPTSVEAYRSLSNTSDYYHEYSYIHWEADHDTFVFNEEQTDGTFTITTEHGASAVNPALAVYDFQTGQMLYIDSDSGSGDEAQIVLPNSGYWNGYLVEVWDVEEDSTGEVDVHIAGSGATGYVTLTPDADGDVSHSGFINDIRDTDYFRLVVPPQASGTLDVSLSEFSGDLRTRLQVWKNDGDDEPEVILSSDQGPEEAQLTGVQPGDVFIISVSDHKFQGTGDYELTVDFSTSLPGTMTSAEGFAYFHSDGISHDTQTFNNFVGQAHINLGDDIDSFYFAGDTGWTGTYTITVNRLSGTVNPVVAVYDQATGEQLGFDRGDGSSAELSLDLTALHRYIVAVADDDNSDTGDVEIIITGPSSSGTSYISLDAAGDGQRLGMSLGINDTDFFRLISPADTNGDLEVTVTPSGGLDVAVVLFDSSGSELAKAYLNGPDETETINVSGLSPSTNYYLTVLSRSYATTGTYDVQVDFDLIVPDVFPGQYNYAIMPDWLGDRTASFYLSTADDWDGWLFANSISTTGAIFTATGSGGIKPILGLYDAATGQRVAWDTNPGDSNTASITQDIPSATRFYIIAGTKDGTTGSVELSMSMAGLHPIVVNIDGDGQGSRADSLSSPAWIDYFRADPPATANGTVTVSLTGLDPGLTGWFELWDDTTGTSLGRAVGGASGGDVSHAFSGIDPTHSYVLAVSSKYFASGSGAYTVNFDFDVALPTTINPASYSRSGWTPNQFGDEEFTHPLTPGTPFLEAILPESSGNVVLDITSSAWSDMALGLYDSAGNRLAYDLGPTPHVDYSSSGPAVYYIYVDTFTGTGSSGNFGLAVDAASFTFIRSIPIDPNTGSGNCDSDTVNPQPDQDFYSVVAPVNAYAVTVTMTPDAGSDLKPYVRLYDGAGVGLAGASAYSGPAEFTYNDVVAGTTYIIGAGGNWFTKGGFDLDVQFALYDVPVTVPPMEYYGPVNIDGDRQFTMALNTVSDRDTWLFTTENGGAATFTATATSGGINPLLALYDGAGDLVAVAETSTGATEMLNYTLNQRELYTILVMDAERDNTGNVDVAIDSPAVTTVPTITLGADGAGSGSEYLGYGNDPARADPDYFQFTAPADASGRLSITVTPDQAFRLEFQLFDSAGAPVGGRYASPSDGAPATHTYTGLTPGETYHICVFAYQFGDHPAGGDFEVAVDFDLRPTVGALDYELKPTIIGEDITLTAIGVADGDGNLQRVEFYRDENDNGTLEIGTDSYLGSDYSAIGGWQRVASTAGMDSGWTWFFTRARDTYGNLSDVARRLACVTYMGDANCDGKVGIADLGALADNYGKTSGATWRDGDFNRDGKVGIADLGALADNYGMGAGGQAAATGGSETAGAAEAEVPPAGSSGSSAAVVPEVSGAELSLPVVQLDVEAAPVGGGDGLTEPPSLTVTVVGDSSSDDQAQEGAVELLDAPSLTVLP